MVFNTLLGYYADPSDPPSSGTKCSLGDFCALGASSPPPLCPAGFYCPNASLIEPIACPTMVLLLFFRFDSFFLTTSF